MISYCLVLEVVGSEMATMRDGVEQTSNATHVVNFSSPRCQTFYAAAHWR